MAGAGLLMLLDDIASILDDVSAMTKVAAKKTAGVLGDDLALNAQQVSGVNADRELPVVWAVAKGSLKNKAILVPAALAISAVAPWLITPLLMVGGAFLCFEGFEKIAHSWSRDKKAASSTPAQNHAPARSESDKIKGAIRTDFILSAEIIVISLGTVATAPFMTQVAVLVAVAVLMTVGVYGLVAGIVKLDDAGLYLSRRNGSAQRALGRGLLRLAPVLMKTLSVVGTAAMFLVGGGILVHGVPALSAAVEHAAHIAGTWPLGRLWQMLTPMLLGAVLGMAAGAIIVAVVALVGKLRPAKR